MLIYVAGSIVETNNVRRFCNSKDLVVIEWTDGSKEHTNQTWSSFEQYLKNYEVLPLLA